MDAQTAIEPITLANLPALGAELAGGEFAGLTTKPDGTHWVTVKLPGYGENLTHEEALAWAKEQGGELPTKAVAAMVVSNLKIKRGWYWTSEVHKDDASYAWLFYSYGYSDVDDRSAAGGALAVRSFQLTA